MAARRAGGAGGSQRGSLAGGGTRSCCHVEGQEMLDGGMGTGQEGVGAQVLSGMGAEEGGGWGHGREEAD